MEAPADGDEEKMEPQDDGGRPDPPPPRVPPLLTQQLQDDSQGSSGDGCVILRALRVLRVPIGCVPRDTAACSMSRTRRPHYLCRCPR